jgi:hypothetical protein
MYIAKLNEISECVIGFTVEKDLLLHKCNPCAPHSQSPYGILTKPHVILILLCMI